MLAKKWLMVCINLVGGVAVLGSYALGFVAHPGAVDVIWGGVPQAFRPIYTANMLLAAGGYFTFSSFILISLDAAQVRVFRSLGFGIFNILFAAILLPSAFWMPLTFWALEQSSQGLLWLTRLDLAIVGLASLGLLFALWQVQPRRPRWAYGLALVGSVLFCVQTVILDAILWSALFRV